MPPKFVKFPSTPHLAVLGDTSVRNDKVMTPAERDLFLTSGIVVEEKIDGANMGISFDDQALCRVQNRGSYLSRPFSGQWARLGAWLESRQDRLFDVLGDRYILFGEWCVAVHSVEYNALPDWFLGFDVYDRSICEFVSSAVRDAMLRSASLHSVPTLAEGQYTLESVESLLGPSKVGENAAEGLYLRVNVGEITQGRAKLVRPEFVQTIADHWSRGTIRQNHLAPWRSPTNEQGLPPRVLERTNEPR